MSCNVSIIYLIYIMYSRCLVLISQMTFNLALIIFIQAVIVIILLMLCIYYHLSNCRLFNTSLYPAPSRFLVFKGGLYGISESAFIGSLLIQDPSLVSYIYKYIFTYMVTMVTLANEMLF